MHRSRFEIHIFTSTNATNVVFHQPAEQEDLQQYPILQCTGASILNKDRSSGNVERQPGGGMQ
jgi:hypothetical protein